jgi:hypothetical protein
MNEKLSACPFCGGEAGLIKTPNRGEFYVRCKTEDIEQLLLHPTKAEAIAAWNKRFACHDINKKPVFAGDEVAGRNNLANDSIKAVPWGKVHYVGTEWYAGTMPLRCIDEITLIERGEG